MKIIKLIAVLGVLAMSTVLLNGFLRGSFSEDGSLLLSNPWGIVSIVDLYVGFAIFSIWVVYREGKSLSALLWVISIMILGFFSASVYLYLAAHRSKGDTLHFIHGKEASRYKEV